jgi:signal transduction histidine kinase
VVVAVQVLMTVTTLSGAAPAVISRADDLARRTGPPGVLLEDDPAFVLQKVERARARGYARIRMQLRRLLDRARDLDRTRLELAVLTVLAVELQVEAALLARHGVDGDARLAVHATMLPLPFAVWLRKRRPVLAITIAQAAFVLMQVHGADVGDNLYIPLFVTFLMAVVCAMHAEGRRFWLVPLVTSLGALLSTTVDAQGNELGDFLWVPVFAGLTALVGRLLRNRARLQAALREKTERLERERVTRAELAVAEERTRIAGDLHDIIAHALSGMVVQASAARRLALTDSERARVAFATVEDSGRDALSELRRLLGVLRRADEELALAPAPSLAHVETLVRRSQGAGLRVELVVEGEPVDLPAGVDLTAYRVLQDALGEARERGGAGAARLVIRYDEDAVELEVRDDGARAGEERHLLGTRERVSLVGGALQAARPRDGGHVVRARLPVEAPA